MTLRAPPSVSVRCLGGPVWCALWWSLPALAVGVAALWLLLHLQPTLRAHWPTSPWWALVAPLPVVWWARRSAPRPVLLKWDGHGWCCQGKAVKPQVMMDLGGWLLLRLRPDRNECARSETQDDAVAQRTNRNAAPRWVAVSARDADGALHAFRAAVYNTGTRTKINRAKVNQAKANRATPSR